MPSLSKQQQKTLEKEYQNWLAVAHALSVMCDGIRPYIEREMKAFHQALLVNLAHFPPCACPRLPNHHETKGANLCRWAKELKKWHRKGQPKWPQSDSTKWIDPNMGHCEVAKVYMSDLGPRAPHVNINNSDPTGLLNLLSWCNHFTVQQHLVSAVRQTRNTWGHSSSLKLSDLERNAAFQSIQDLLQDPALATDPDALNALAEINNITKDGIAQDVERKLLREALNSNDQVIKEFREQMKKDKSESRGHRSTKNLEKQLKKSQKREREKKVEIEKRLEMLETSFEKEREKMAEIEKRLQSIEDAPRPQESFIKRNVKDMLIKGALLLGMLMRFLHKFTFLFAFLGCFVLLDPTSFEDGCPMETSSILQPDLRQFNFTSYLNTAREGFIGRKWLFDTIEDVLKSKTNDLSAVVIVGEPGSGKSAIAAQLICSRSSSSLIHNNILGYHLCKHLDKMTQDGGKFVKNLVDMIARRIPGFMEIVSTSSIIQRVLREDHCSSDPHGCLEQTIVAPLRQLKGVALENKLYFIVVDAIDECTSGDSRSIDISGSISELLRHKMVRLPSWLKLIITARNDSKTLKYFSKSVKIDLFPSHANNMDDIDSFITKTLYEHSSLFQKLQTMFKFAKEDEMSGFTSSLLRQSQGNFLFVKELLHYRLSDISNTSTMAKSIPPTIGGIYYGYFQRAYGSEEKFRSARKMLEVLVATLVPLLQEEVYKVVHLEDPKRDYTYNEFMVKLNGLSHFLRYGEGNTVSLFHLSLLEWLVDENNIGSPFFVDKDNGHRALANYYLQNAKNSSNVTQTSIFCLAQHIAFSGSLSNYHEEFNKLPTNLITSPIDDTQRTLLHLAAAVKNVDVLRLLLPYFPRLPDLQDNYGITPAFIAAAQGALENLEFLVDAGANISHRTNPPPRPPYEFHQDPIVASKSSFWSSTMLHAASRNGHLDVVKFLIQRHDVSLSVRDGVNFTALQLAAQNGHLKVVSFLHKNGAQTDQVALYHAAANGHDEVVKFLLQDARVKDECMRCDGSFYWLGGKTRYQAALIIEPEYKTSRYNRKYKRALWHLAQPKHLRLNVSDFLFVDDEHLLFCQTALHVSVLKGYQRVAQTLILQSANGLHCMDFSGRTPLHYAVKRNNKETVKLLLRAGAGVSQRCLFSQNLTSFSSKTCKNGYKQYDHLSVMEELQYVSDRCPFGSNPIHLAARYGHSRMAAVLNNYGASFYTRDFQGATLLHIAACHGQTDFIQWLISSSTNMHINTGSENGSTPLHSAAICGRFEEIPILIGLGANITSRDNKGMTPLHYTALTPSHKTIDRIMPSDIRDHTKVFKTQVLSFSRLRMWLSNDEDLVRLDYFFDNDDLDKTRILKFDRHCKTARRLMKHMDVRTINQADDLGRTALHLGAENGLECVVGFLLASNANPQKEDNASLTPLEKTIQFYDALASFDGFSMELYIDKKTYDSLITQTECKTMVTDPSMKDLIKHVLSHLDHHTAVVHILFSWELEMQENGKSPTFMLHLAIEERQPHLVLLLLLMGADVNKEDSLGRTPLLVYLQHGGNYTASILKQFNVRVPVKCGEPFASSPFHLLSYRAPSSQCDNFFYSNVKSLWDLELKTCGEHLASKCYDAEGYTPLHRAAQGGNIEAIEKFLRWGVDVNLVSRDGHTPLFLAIKDAGLKPDLWSVMIDSTKASTTAILLFREVLKKNNFKIKCDGTSKKLTIYHLAAYRGLDQFIDLLLSGPKPLGFNIDCPDKFGVTPLYLANLFAGVETDNQSDPWKRIVRLIESYGGTLRYPQRGAEFRILYTHLYDTSKQPTHVNVGLANEVLQLLETGAVNLDHCFRMFQSYVPRNDTSFLIDLVLKPFRRKLNSFREELLNTIGVRAVGTTVSDYLALMERDKYQSDDVINSQEKKPLTTPKEQNFDPNDIVFSKSAAFTEFLQQRKMFHRSLFFLNETYRTQKTWHNYVHLLLSQHHEFFIRHQTSLSDFSSVRAMKKLIPVLHQNLFCLKIDFYKEIFVNNLQVHLQISRIENEWTWKRMSRLKETPFVLSRLPLALKNITNFLKAYSPFEAQDLIHLIRIALRKGPKFDYLDMLAFGNDRSLWKAIHRYEFDLSLLSELRKVKLTKVSMDYVKGLVRQLKEDEVETWERYKAKVKKLKTVANFLGQEQINPS